MTALFALLLAGAQPSGGPVVYQCSERIADFEGTGGALTLTKGFRREGSPSTFEVVLEDGSGRVAAGRASDTHTSLTIRWSADPRVEVSGATTPLYGWIEIELYGDARSLVTQRDEQWRRVLVDRNGLLLLHSLPDGGQGIVVPHRGLYLSSELLPLNTNYRRLGMLLGDLLVWGGGRERLTVYETVVTPMRQRRRNWDRAVGLERVVGTYEIDMAALARLAASALTVAEAWEAGLTDVTRRCEQVPAPEPRDEDIITGAPPN